MSNRQNIVGCSFQTITLSRTAISFSSKSYNIFLFTIFPGSGSGHPPVFLFNEDGSNEIWVDDTDRKEIVLKDLKNDLKLAEERLTLASEELSKLKYLPEKDEDRIKKLTLEKINNKELNKFS